MKNSEETSDDALLDLLRLRGGLRISEMAEATGVTATAVRQRLTRLMGQQLVRREAQRTGRGRPSHRYLLTDKGLRTTGNNYFDLAFALWSEVREISDPEIRRGLLQRIANRLAASYGDQLKGRALIERMQAICDLMAERSLPFSVEQREGEQLPVIMAGACPYPELAEKDRSVCAMEKMMFSAVLGADLRLAACRLDGDACCTFEAS
ncbi:MAG: transcriptional regulator [Planctomycetales bacterium]|nr:transcriptional regulator [Planctomycetales bacterium]